MDRNQQAVAAILMACMVLRQPQLRRRVGRRWWRLRAVDNRGDAVWHPRVGAWEAGTVYAATVRNTCRCAQSDVKVASAGFDTTLAVDPAKLKQVAGGVCLVNGGAPVAPGQSVTFRYASSRQFAFRPVSVTVAC